MATTVRIRNHIDCTYKDHFASSQWDPRGPSPRVRILTRHNDKAFKPGYAGATPAKPNHGDGGKTSMTKLSNSTAAAAKHTTTTAPPVSRVSKVAANTAAAPLPVLTKPTRSSRTTKLLAPLSFQDEIEEIPPVEKVTIQPVKRRSDDKANQANEDQVVPKKRKVVNAPMEVAAQDLTKVTEDPLTPNKIVSKDTPTVSCPVSKERDTVVKLVPRQRSPVEQAPVQMQVSPVEIPGKSTAAPPSAQAPVSPPKKVIASSTASPSFGQAPVSPRKTTTSQTVAVNRTLRCRSTPFQPGQVPNLDKTRQKSTVHRHVSPLRRHEK